MTFGIVRPRRLEGLAFSRLDFVSGLDNNEDMKRILFICTLLSTGTAAHADSACEKEMKLKSGVVRSSVYAGNYGMGLCSVYVTQFSNNDFQQQYTFQPGGILHHNDNRSNAMHSMAFVAPGQERSSFSQSAGNFHVHQPGLSWQFSGSQFHLSGIQNESGQSCLSQQKGEQIVPITSSSGFDLKSCTGVVAMDFGSSSTRQTAPLKRSSLATLKANVNGQLQACRVPIGKLFEYQTGHRDTKGQTIIVEQGYDPCYMYASQQFPQLPPVQAIAQLKQQNPTHACITMKRGNLADYPETYKPIPAGLSDLSGDLNISYRLLAASDLSRNILSADSSPSCRAIAGVLSSGSAGPAPATQAPAAARSTR